MAGPIDLALVIDGAVALIAIEVLLFIALRSFYGSGPMLLTSLANGMAGAALLLAMRAALRGASFAVTGAWLSVALLAHIVDVASRWRDARRVNSDRTPAEAP